MSLPPSKSEASPNDLTPPTAHPVEHRSDWWGETLVDPYHWLQERESPAVRAHLEAENAYTENVLAPVAELRETLFAEIKGRIKETDMSVPISKDEWSYYSRTREGEDYGIHCRRPVSTEQDMTSFADEVAGNGTPTEEVLLDENVEAGESEFFDIGLFDVSPDHKLLLWGADRTGDERFSAYVRDLTTGEDIDDGLVDLSYGSAWALDGQTFFYVRPDSANRPHEVWRHRIGTPVADDELVYREDDERFWVGVGRDKDDTYIHIGSSSKVTDEIRIIPAAEPMTTPRLIAERRQGVEYSADHVGDRFVILTNDEAQNFRVVTAPEANPGPENWSELIAEDPLVMVSGLDVSANHLTLFERTGGGTRIRMRAWSNGSFVDDEFTEIDQPESVSTVWPGANPEFEATTLRYGYSSMVTPPSLFLLDTKSGERTLLKQQEVLGDFDQTRYTTERRWATSPDGTDVPVSLVWRTDGGELGAAGGSRPCVLYAYGAYEISTDPTFSSARLSLLDRGFVFAIAHARGGGEMGRQWYLDGKFERKQNTFSDVIAVARELIDSGVTSADRLVLRGGSAGGLMAGAVVNQAPELFCGVVAHVAFVDALNTILDPSQPLTVTEWEEWGNPTADESIFRAMKAYSPYENVSEQKYPSILATGGLHDTRVNYWEPAKWIQRLRQHTTGSAPILLWTDLAAGHGGPSGRYEAWREEARILAYILLITGLQG